jgi:hypothetical protein
MISCVEAMVDMMAMGADAPKWRQGRYFTPSRGSAAGREARPGFWGISREAKRSLADAPS